MKKIIAIIYTKNDCLYSTGIKDWFKEHQISYQEIRVNTQDERLNFYQQMGLHDEFLGTDKEEISELRIPQVFINEKRIGGYKELLSKEGLIIKNIMGGGLTKFSETYKPFYYPWAVELCRNHEQAHWIEDEIDLAEDVADWKSGTLNNIEKEYITNILRLFTQSDVAVGQNYYDQFIPIFKNNEIRNLLGSFAAREGIHQRAYALLNDTLGLEDSEYEAFLDYQEMADKVEFMMARKNKGTKRGTGLGLARMVFNEGVALFASFVMLLNFQRFGKMKGMGKIVEWSIRDETMHVEGNSRLFRSYCAENPSIVDENFKKEIYEMARISVKLEDRFINLAYKIGEIEGLTAKEVKEYIRYTTDRRLLQLGLIPVFKIKENPLPWLDWVLNGVDHTNFFENRVTEYEVAGLVGEWEKAYQ